VRYRKKERLAVYNFKDFDAQFADGSGGFDASHNSRRNFDLTLSMSSTFTMFQKSVLLVVKGQSPKGNTL